MGYDRTASKRTINVSLNGDLVRQAQSHTDDLDNTLETLLADFVNREQLQRQARNAAIDQTICALDSFHAEHGYLSDEFTTL